VTHLAREELERWWAEGSPADRERIEGHLAECDACGALYGEVIDAGPALPSAAVATDPGLVARGYRAFDSRARGGRMPPRVAVWLAAAAAVAIVALGPLVWRSRPEADGIRGSSLQPLAPVGAVVPPLRVQWTSPVETAGYTVEVRDAEQRLLFSLAGAGEEVALPAERLAGLTPGRTYWWTVVAREPSGEEVMRSPPRAFSIVSGPR
jgi:hypothetical protein